MAQAPRTAVRAAPTLPSVQMPQTNVADMIGHMREVLVADAPREPSKQERRIIFAKLEEVYGDEKVGYTAPWTDAAVAKDLGVPVAWVADVREPNFGPQGNADITKLLEDVAALRAEGEEIQRDMVKFKTQTDLLTTQGNTLAARVSTIARRFDSLSTQADRIRQAMEG